MSFDYKEETNRLFELLKGVTDSDDRIQIRNRVIELNIRLVPLILKKYKPYNEDHFQIGCMGLITAAQTYQPMRQVPFSSYACFCIERELQLEHNKHKEDALELNGALLSLDAEVTTDSGDTLTTADLIEDTRAEAEMQEFIVENELTFICNNIIKPGIEQIADRGKHMTSKMDVDEWQKLEFSYIMGLVFLESQKKRFNLTQMAQKVGVSVQNVRTRHERVMEVVFQRMWDYMQLPFSDMLERLRGTKKIPGVLLCLDPGKTTGWCTFVNGVLADVGHLENCYDDTNIKTDGLISLLTTIKPDFIVYEDYRVYAHKLERHSYSQVHTIRLIGAIEVFCQMNHISTHKQMAVTAKGFVTDEKLEQWDMWKPAMKHARDAIRHGCYFLLFYKKGQDII
jgi:hypothetical protein